ncbi:MAG: hypothetical protein WCJ92_07715 [Alphaproteobacteria bacterium]
MKTIQKFTLGLLAVVATSTSTFASNIFLDVESGSATHSGVITGTAQKIGGGTLVMSGANDNATHTVLTNLAINNGRVQYGATGNVGAKVTMADTFGSGVALEVLMGAATVASGSAIIAAKSVVVPPLAMTSAAQLQIDANVAATLSAFDSGTAALSLVAQSSAAALAAPAVASLGATSVAPFTCTAIAASVLGTSATGYVYAVPINVGSGVNLQVASGGRLPNAQVDVSGQLEIQTATANQCPGSVIIENAAVLYVDSAVAVPADSPAASDLFGSLKFNSGSTLKLGNGASWARNITVVDSLMHRLM